MSTVLNGETGGATNETSTNGAVTNSSGNANNGGSSPVSGTSWKDSLPDDIKTHGAIAPFNDIPSLVKSYISGQEMIGKKGVIPPSEKSTPEEWNKFFDTVGRPALDKYEVKAPDGVQISPETVKWFKETAHKVGLLPKQAQDLLGTYVKYEQEQRAATAKATEQEQTTKIAGLKKEWGDGWDKQVRAANLAVEAAGEEFAKYLATSKLGNDPQLIKAFAALGTKFMTEDQLRGDGSGKFGVTPAEAQKEINQIMGDTKHPYYDASHPGHRAAVEHLEGLFKSIQPQSA